MSALLCSRVRAFDRTIGIPVWDGPGNRVKGGAG